MVNEKRSKNEGDRLVTGKKKSRGILIAKVRERGEDVMASLQKWRMGIRKNELTSFFLLFFNFYFFFFCILYCVFSFFA